MIWKWQKSWPRTNHSECNEGQINGKPAVHFHCIVEPVLHYSTATFPPGILTKATCSGGHCRSEEETKRKRKEESFSSFPCEICTCCQILFHVRMFRLCKINGNGEKIRRNEMLGSLSYLIRDRNIVND